MPPLDTPDGRRGWALLALIGGAMAFTVIAFFGAWELRKSEGFLFWLTLCAQGQVAIVLASLGGLLVKRMFKVTRDGIDYSDQRDGQP